MSDSPLLRRSLRRLSIAALMTALCFPVIAVRADDGRMSMAEQGRELPRVILGLFDSRREPNPEESRIHRLLDMPLNHLGLVVRYHDIAKGLPDPASLADVRGVGYFLRRRSPGFPGLCAVGVGRPGPRYALCHHGRSGTCRR